MIRMKNKTWIEWIIIIYCSFVAGLMIYCIGHIIGFNKIKNQYEEQIYINESIYKTYEELRTNYDILEIQYKKDLDDCYQQMGDMQDDYDVNNDGVINAQDYVAIKNYIMNREEECYVNGGWNCE